MLNVCHSALANERLDIIIYESVISFLTMCLLYSYNDYSDRHRDISNRKKDKALTVSIIENEKMFSRLLFILKTTIVFFAVFSLGIYKAMVILSLFIVNFSYSKKIKSIPGLDLVTLLVWGGLFVMVAGPVNIYLSSVAGIMVGIAHVFQMLTDAQPDSEGHINTTIVALHGKAVPLLLILCGLLYAALFLQLGAWWSVTAILPAMVFGVTGRIGISWNVSRGYFFICWVYLLILFYR